MIRTITGTIVESATEHVVADVHGVGYLIYTPAGHRYPLESTQCFYTHLAVRENALDLYGFSLRDELDLFLALLNIPKIGPKSALEIMSKADVTTIKSAVLSDDPAYLSKVSGLGKKTAEKVVVGLKDRFDPNDINALTNAHNSVVPAYTSDAIDALVALGYPSSDARKVILALPPTVTTANEAVREALRALGQM